MAQSSVWTTKSLEETTVVTPFNKVLDIQFKGATHRFVLPEGTYRTTKGIMKSELVDELNKMIAQKSLPIKVHLGTMKEKGGPVFYMVFSYQKDLTLTYSGTFKNIIGDTSFVAIPESDFMRSTKFPLKVETNINGVDIKRNPQWTYTKGTNNRWSVHYSNEANGDSFSLAPVTETNSEILHFEKGLTPLKMYEYNIIEKDINGKSIESYKVKSVTGSRRQLITKGGAVNPEGSVSISGDASLIAWGDDRKDSHLKGDLFYLNIDTGIQKQVTDNDDWDVNNTVAKDGSKVACSANSFGSTSIIQVEGNKNLFLLYDAGRPVFSENLNHLLTITGTAGAYTLKVYSVLNAKTPIHTKTVKSDSVVLLGVSDDGKRIIYQEKTSGKTEAKTFATDFKKNVSFEIKYSDLTAVKGVDLSLNRFFYQSSSGLAVITIDWENAAYSKSVHGLQNDIDIHKVVAPKNSNLVAYSCTSSVKTKEGSDRFIHALNLDTDKSIVLTDNLYGISGDVRFDANSDMEYIVYPMKTGSSLQGYVEYVGHKVATIRS